MAIHWRKVLFKLKIEHYCGNAAKKDYHSLPFFSCMALIFIHINFPALLSFLYYFCIFITYDF